jgi:hypothetical protein
MGTILTGNIDLQGGLPLDSRYGLYSSTTQANQSIVSANRFVGLTVGIVTGTTSYNGIQLTGATGGVSEYWYYTGTTDSDLVLKQGESGDGFTLSGNTTDGLISYGTPSIGIVESNLTFNGSNNTLTLSGDSITNGVEYQQTEDTNTVTNGNHNIYSIPLTSGCTFEYTYFVEEDNTGVFRSGKILTSLNNSKTNVVYNDYSTIDGIGTTEDIEFESLISGSNLILRAVTTNNTQWTIKIKLNVLF